ncbi:hypothetical protein EHQ68_00315 [Leptospira congkakensis]|uniref:DUF1554 domain-containing protein n=1 Tax=Leptospira congkakensis TaxID=2484932 RepID=A0A4Z1ADG5_9LEPT|nr:hypothetical protein [Leptospira congkakensis]TGL87843.1 hypothetical protein EHQ69_17250 [Leptospira congkakensis]TGL92620.1 hypothetical protein EHQ68_00315 [Leptospira congkakensis]TGL95994.1 hypothetical protein EHQ70_12920 [Leptospira congkakensis]
MKLYQPIKSFLSILALSILLFSNCSGQVSAGDTFLFGLSERFDRLLGNEATVACSSDVTITTKAVYLEEDGDTTATFNASNDSGLTLSGAQQWGYSTFETCIYPNSPFSGSVEIPVTVTSNYGSRVASVKSFPGAEVAIPTKLTFTGNGVAERQCFKFTASHDSLRNPVVDPMIVALGTMTQKDGSGNETSGTYTGKDACDITLSLDDADSPGVRVSNISRVMEEPSPSATETNGTFQIRLRTAPTANVTIPINDTYDSVNANNREGTANPKTLTFTTANFATPQLVTVTAVDDLEIDGVKVYTVEVGRTSSSDSEYNGIKPRNVVVYNRDQSVPGYAYIRFDTTTGSTGTAGGAVDRFATDESNQFGTKYSNFQLKLRTKPTNNVTLTFSSNCGNKCNILTPTLTFTSTNWNVYQTFQVEGKSDSANSGNANYTVSFVASSADATYNTTVTEPTFTIRSCDNDGTHLLQPCNFSGSPLATSGASDRLTATEGGTSHIWMIAQSNPGADVTIGLTSTDTSEGTVPASVTVSSTNYNFMESGGTNRILLTHVDDNEVDGTVNWDVTTALSTGAIAYNPIDIFARTTDNEAYFYVTKLGSTKEGSSTPADTATIHVCLGAQNVETITVSVACATHAANTAAFGECGTLSTATLTFPAGSRVDDADASNANCANSARKQTVTILGADDSFADGSQDYTVNLTKDANTDAVYSSGAATLSNQTITNRDDEPLGKAIFVTTTGAPGYNGEMTAQGVFGADNTCNNYKPGGVPTGTYKALIVSNSGGDPTVANNRIPNGTNWVLTANYHYYRCNTSGYTNCSDEYSRLFVANGSAGFDPTSLIREFSTVGQQYWTGMTNTLAPATQGSTPACAGDGLTYRHNCHGFTYQNCPSTPASFLYGQSWTMASTTSITSQESVCSETKHLICVQQ